MTWIVREVTVRRETLNFTSSGQGYYGATQIVLDGGLFANAAGLTTWNDDRIQVVVCEACGVERCGPGGWLALRSVGELRVFVPTFGDWNVDERRQEYAPPRLVVERGAPVFDPSAYGRLREIVSEVPAEPRPMTGGEARELVVFEAPSGIRFDVGRLELTRRFLAACDAEVDQAVDALLTLLRELESAAELVARPLTPGDERVTLYVDDANFTEWTPFALSSKGPRLLWGPWLIEH